MTKRLYTRILLIKIILPLIYGGFFVAQLFANFDNAFVPGNDRFLFIKSLNHGIHFAAIEKGKAGQPLKSKFRLNKRFQPGGVAMLPVLSFTPVISFTLLKRVPVVNCFKTNFLLDTRSLRGPPPMA